MTLREKQSEFVRLVAQLIDHATSLGYELTFGEAWRTPEQAALNARRGTGIARSLHCDRIAIDLNLFRGGVFLSDSINHRPLGEWWEKQSTPEMKCRWGGNFSRPDGNHYSIEHEGRA